MNSISEKVVRYKEKKNKQKTKNHLKNKNKA